MNIIVLYIYQQLYYLYQQNTLRWRMRERGPRKGENECVCGGGGVRGKQEFERGEIVIKR